MQDKKKTVCAKFKINERNGAFFETVNKETAQTRAADQESLKIEMLQFHIRAIPETNYDTRQSDFPSLMVIAENLL